MARASVSVNIIVSDVSPVSSQPHDRNPSLLICGPTTLYSRCPFGLCGENNRSIPRWWEERWQFTAALLTTGAVIEATANDTAIIRSWDNSVLLNRPLLSSLLEGAIGCNRGALGIRQRFIEDRFGKWNARGLAGCCGRNCFCDVDVRFPDREGTSDSLPLHYQRDLRGAWPRGGPFFISRGGCAGGAESAGWRAGRTAG